MKHFTLIGKKVANSFNGITTTLYTTQFNLYVMMS